MSIEVFNAGWSDLSAFPRKVEYSTFTGDGAHTIPTDQKCCGILITTEATAGTVLLFWTDDSGLRQIASLSIDANNQMFFFPSMYFPITTGSDQLQLGVSGSGGADIHATTWWYDEQ